MNYPRLFDLNLAELLDLPPEILLNPAEQSYRRILIAYLRFSASEIHSEIQKNQLDPSFLEIALLRKALVSGENLASFIDTWKEAYLGLQPMAQAEMLFCLTIASFKLGRYEEASYFSIRARSLFKKIESPKKSVKSFLNYIVAESNIYPDSRFFQEYLQLSRDAEIAAEWASASVAQLNISREYQRVGALEASLDFSIRAIQSSEKHVPGGREYGLAILQKASVLLEMNRKSDAEHLIGLVSVVDHPEVQETLKLLKLQFSEIMSSSKNPHLLERWGNPDAQATRLGNYENLLIELLSKGQKTSSDLEELLFPDVLNALSRKDRLKNLISRVRKKHPSLIIFTQGHYTLSEVEMSKIKIRKAGE